MPAMSDPSFTLLDAKGVFVALCLLLATMTPLGYWLAIFLQAEKFNQLSPTQKFFQATMLACAFAPILFFLLWRVNFYALVCLIIISTISFIFKMKVLVGPNPNIDLDSSKKSDKYLRIALLVWSLIALFVTIDFSWGKNLYMSVVCFDYEKHVAIANSLMQNGVPPTNPMFNPGHSVGLYYYYFWFTIAALIAKCSFHQASAYASTIASTMWTGMAFIGLVYNLQKFFYPGQEKTLKTSLFLLFVSGLDILLVAPINYFGQLTNKPQALDSVEWWSLDQVSAWLEMLVWVPHHITGCIAVFSGIFLFLSYEKNKWKNTIASAICFASAFGSSVYLALVGISSLCIYILICFLKEKTNSSLSNIFKLLAALAVVFVLVLPFYSDLHSINANNESKIKVAVRSSGLIRCLIEPEHRNFTHIIKDQIGLAQPDTSNWAENLFLLLINYPFELGFYFLAALLYWHKRPIQKEDWLALSIFATSLLIATFLRSTIHNNDLGWRGLIPAQLILLLWSAQYLSTYKINFKKTTCIALQALLIIGAATTFYDIYLLRFSQLNPNRELQECDPKKNYAVRLAYQNLLSKYPPNSIIQANPNHARDPFMGLYSERPTLVSDNEYGPLFGIDYGKFTKVKDSVTPLFNGNLTYQVVKDFCQKQKIAALVVKWNDPVFNNKSSWINDAKPVYQNDFVKVFDFAN